MWFFYFFFGGGEKLFLGMKRFPLKKIKFSVHCGLPPCSASHPPSRASSSPSLSVSCALHAEMISIPAELMRFCWTEKRQGKCVHIHTQRDTQREEHTHTHTVSTALFQSAFTHAHSDSLKLGHFFFFLFQNTNSVLLHFKVNLQKCGQRQSWTTITHIQISWIRGTIKPTFTVLSHTNMKSPAQVGPSGVEPSHHSNTLTCIKHYSSSGVLVVPNTFTVRQNVSSSLIPAAASESASSFL